MVKKRNNIVYAGIDPGQTGAIAFIENNEVSVYDPPMKHIIRNGKSKKDYDLIAMANILKNYKNKHVIIYIEDVFSMSGQGVSSTFNFGRGKGIWEGMAHAFGFEVHMVTPQTWKKEWPELKAPKIDEEIDRSTKEYRSKKQKSKAVSKVAARNLASELYPSSKNVLKTVKSDGRAEAILIARYAQDKCV